MAFEITNETLSKPAFRSGLNKVLSAESKDHKVIYNLGRVGDKIEQAIKEAQRDMRKLAKSHKVLNEQGIIGASAEGNDAWEKAYEDFMKHPVKVERRKIRLEDIREVPLSPLELNALEPILDGIDRLAN